MPTGKCALCLQEKDLRNSHVIPEFMYTHVYDKNPKRFYELNIKDKDIKTGKSKIEQKGYREYLLCQDCESKLSLYEKYADETIYGKNNNNRARIINSFETRNQRFFLHNVVGYDYKKFKIFLFSLVWRLLVSEKFNLKIENQIAIEELRIAILEENPLKYNEYPCFVQSILYEKNKPVSGIILNPYITKTDEGIDIVNILIDEFIYSFHLGKNLSAKTDEHFLREDGTMNIVGRIIFDDEGLFNMLKLSFEFFKTVKRK